MDAYNHHLKCNYDETAACAKTYFSDTDCTGPIHYHYCEK